MYLEGGIREVGMVMSKRRGECISEFVPRTKHD